MHSTLFGLQFDPFLFHFCGTGWNVFAAQVCSVGRADGEDVSNDFKSKRTWILFSRSCRMVSEKWPRAAHCRLASILSASSRNQIVGRTGAKTCGLLLTRENCQIASSTKRHRWISSGVSQFQKLRMCDKYLPIGIWGSCSIMAMRLQRR